MLPEELERLKKLQLYPDDVWIVTYPKSGTTWTQQIVKLIRNNGVPDDTVLTRSIPHPEIVKGLNLDIKIDEMPRPRAFKSHFPYHMMLGGPPHTTPCKYIYVM